MNSPAAQLVLAEDLDAEATYRLLTGVIVPRPIAWVTSVSDTGVVNLAPFSAFTFVSTKPPMLGISIGRKQGRRKDTANHLLARREYVVHIADVSLVAPLHESAVEHPPELSEVDLLGLATAAGQRVAVPRLLDAPVAMECRLHSVTPYGDTGSEFFVGEVLAFHLREGLLRKGKVDTMELQPLARLGGPNYATLGGLITQRDIGQTTKSVLPQAPEQP